MLITIHLTDGRKITKEQDRLHFFSTTMAKRSDFEYPDLICVKVPEILEGCITVNLNHVVDMRLAEAEEIEHARIHGW